jgi:hypothetical protein
MTPFGEKMAQKRRLDEAGAASFSGLATPVRPNDRVSEMGNRGSRHHPDEESTTKAGFMDHK